jgi:hypothetical protein
MRGRERGANAAAPFTLATCTRGSSESGAGTMGLEFDNGVCDDAGC